MSLKPQVVYLVPEDTARVARAIFPNGHPYLRMYDALGTIFQDRDFVALFPPDGQPAHAPVRLALATILQFAEGLSDRQAADAVRSRIDWKFLLCLELTDPGFDHTVLSEFRSRLLDHNAELLLFDTVLARLREVGLLKRRGTQRTDSTHVLAAVRALNRLECVGETLRATLNSLAIVAPDWLRAHSDPRWVDRYGPRVEECRLPQSAAARQAHAAQIGADGYTLLTAVFADTAPRWVREVPAVQTLWRVWIHNYQRTAGTVQWRTPDNTPPSSGLICSPYDPDAHYAKKRETTWIGYKVHVSETCDDDAPHLITHLETTPASAEDVFSTTPIHAALHTKDLLPAVHLVDTGYVDAAGLVTSRRTYGVDLYGPAHVDTHWQAQAGQGFASHHFRIDWDQQQATCPEGKTSVSWTPTRDTRGKEVIKIKFASGDCRACPQREHCTRAADGRRMLTIRRQDEYLALQAARQRQATEEFKVAYRRRAGIEGTLSQGVRSFDLRRSRYVGAAKTHLQHVLIGTAINLVRVGHWLADEPRAKTRQSAFVRLHRAAPA